MLERIIYALFPTLLLQGTPWYEQRMETERRENVALWRLVFPVIALIYVWHYYYFDKPMGLSPAEFWFRFRMSIAGMSIATALFYCSPSFSRLRAYKAPAFASLWVLCYTQARTIIWYDDSQYLYSFLFVVISATLMRASMLTSLVFTVVALSSQWPSLMQSSVSPPALYSGVVATLLFVAIARSRYLGDIRYFLANQQNIEAQRRMIEMNIEFNDRIRAFLPKEISSRLTGFLTANRMTVLQAVDEVLKPTRRDVACLFTDIRGFTQGTKRSDSFVNKGVIPNVTKCTTIIERHRGIPRKVGDLIFAYFDAANPHVNLIRCIQSGFEVVRANLHFNSERAAQDEIHRYVLVSSGPAIVGNLGGYDSSIEITALGSPVNLLSRIDELTKHQAFKCRVSEADLILCDRSAQLLFDLNLGLELNALSLAEVGTVVRDFEEVHELWLLPTTDKNVAIISRAAEYVETHYEHHEGTPN